MKINIEKTSDVERKLNVEIPWKSVEEEIEQVLARIKKTASLKGFRKGKAPMDMIRKVYAGEAREDAVNNLVADATRKAMTDNDLTPLGNPYLTDVQSKEKEPLVFEAMVELSPTFEMADYSSLELEKPVRDITDGDVDGFLFTLRERAAEAVPLLEDRPLREEDVAVVDFKGSKGGEVLEGMDIQDFEIRLGREQLIPGFEEQIVGMKPDQDRQFDLPFPEDYPQENLAGETVHFDVSLKQIKEVRLAELDDDFAKAMGEFETLDDLRKTIREDLEKTAAEDSEKALRANLAHKLLETNVFDVPPSLVDKEIRYLGQEYGENLIKSGMSHEKVNEMILANEENIKKTSADHVRMMYMVGRIAEKEEIKAEITEIQAVIAQAAQNTGKPPKELMDQYTEDGTINEITLNIVRNKVFDKLLETAKVKDVKVKEEKAETPEKKGRKDAKKKTKAKKKS
jgi:trigger factor